MAQMASRNCEICTRATGEEFCQDCSQLFCKDCKNLHLRTNISKNHLFENSTIKSKPSIVCEDHQREFIYRCNKCDVLVCCICVTKNHKKHNVSDIKEEVKELECTITEDSNLKVGELNEKIEKLEQGKQTYVSEIEQIIKNVRADGEMIKKLVDEKVESLVKLVKEEETIECEKLSTQCNKFEVLLSEIKSKQEFYDNLVQTNENSVLLPKLKEMMLELKTIKKYDPVELPTPIYDRKGVTVSYVDKMFGSFTVRIAQASRRNLWSSYDKLQASFKHWVEKLDISEDIGCNAKMISN